MSKIQKSKVKKSTAKGELAAKLKKSTAKKTILSSKDIGKKGGEEEFILGAINQSQNLKASKLKTFIIVAFITLLGACIYFSWPYWSFAQAPYFSIDQLKTKINPTVPKNIDYISNEQLAVERQQLKKSLSLLMERMKVIENAVVEVKKLAQATIPPSEKPIESTALNVLNGRLKTLEKNNVTINKLLKRINQIKKDEGKRKIKQAETKESGYQYTATPNNPAALVMAVENLRKAITSSGPFNKPLEALKKIAGETLKVKTAILLLTKNAQAGIPSKPNLKRRFNKISGKIVQASHLNDKSDWKSRVINRLASVATWRRVDGKGNDNSIDTIVASAETEIRTNNLKAAVIKLKGLSKNSKAAAIAKTWLIDANKRIAADRAVNFLYLHANSKLTTSYPKKEQKR
jgi:hypothetical protein